MDVERIIEKLFDIGAIKFGDFTLKSGISSPFYIDLRLIVSYPDLLKQISDLMWTKIKSLKFDLVCGVPYTALPVATCISTNYEVPMVMRRKEEKTYGTRKCIEGAFNQRKDHKDQCIIIEDLITSGTSIVETYEALSSVGIVVKDAIVLIDRQQGGEKNLEKYNIKLHSVTTIADILRVLSRSKQLTEKLVKNVESFLKDNQSVALNLQSNTTASRGPHDDEKRENSVKKISLEKRLEIIQNNVAKRLVQIMIDKKTCLCVAADVTTCSQLLQLAELVGPFICLLKTHVDILADFDPLFLPKLKKVADKHNFLIFEDRKFADIGNTVKQQFSGGVYNITSWADIINCHVIPGPGIIDGLKEASIEYNKNKHKDKDNTTTANPTIEHGLLLLAEMSSEGNLVTPEYTKQNISFAETEKYKDFVIGFISMGKISSNPMLLHMTPGVSLQNKGDNLGQQYLTPEYVICEKGTDVIIVGRGIYQSKDPAKSAKEYQQLSWDAYLKSFK